MGFSGDGPGSGPRYVFTIGRGCRMVRREIVPVARLARTEGLVRSGAVRWRVVRSGDVASLKSPSGVGLARAR